MWSMLTCCVEPQGSLVYKSLSWYIDWLIDLFTFRQIFTDMEVVSHTYSYIKENRSVQNICHNNILQANRNTNNMSKLCYMIHNNL